MPFNPSLPVDHTEVDATELRGQFNALHDENAALTAPVTAQGAQLATQAAQIVAQAAQLTAQAADIAALQSALASGIAGTAFGRVAADWTSGSASFTAVGGLSFNVAAGESWTAEIVLHAISGTTGQGLKLRVAGPGAGAVLVAMLGTGSGGTSTAIDCEVQTAFSVASPAKTFCSGSSLTGVVRVHVVVTNASASGTVQLQASNTSGSGTVTIKASSDLVARRTG